MNKVVIPAMSRVLFDSDLIITRLMLGFSELLWAILLLWPGDTFSRPTYHVMSEIASEEMWALVFLVTGAVQFTIVGMEHFHSTFARYFAAWNAALWTFVVVGMFLSVYPPPAAISGEVALMFAAVWIWIRPAILMMGMARANARK